MGRRDRGVTDMRWGVVGKEMRVCRWVDGAGGRGTGCWLDTGGGLSVHPSVAMQTCRSWHLLHVRHLVARAATHYRRTAGAPPKGLHSDRVAQALLWAWWFQRKVDSACRQNEPPRVG